MDEPGDPLSAYIAAASALLGIKIEPEWTPEVRATLDVVMKRAAFVAEFPLPDDAEPAPVFEA